MPTRRGRRVSVLREGPRIPREGTPRRAVLVVVLGALSAFGPLSMDFYLPAMPQLASELGADDALAQATMAACMIGLAVGQLISGPWSDRAGRRLPLTVGVALFAITSVGCALAPTIETLLAVRFVQGVAGAAGIVIARAIVRDLYSGAAAARTFSHLMLVIGVAPIVAPLLGGGLLVWVDWRGLFVILAGVGVVLFLATLFFVPETLERERRAEWGLAPLARQAQTLVQHRPFVYYALAMGINQAILFTYVQMGALIYQGQFGLDAQQFSIAFSVNAVVMVIASQTNGALLGRFGPRRLLIFAISVASVGSLLVVGAGLLALPIVVVIAVVALTTGMHGFSMPNINALGLEPFARGAGLASATLGAMQFFVGGLIPVVAAFAGVTVTGMGITMAICAVVALGFVLLAGRAGKSGATSDAPGAA